MIRQRGMRDLCHVAFRHVAANTVIGRTATQRKLARFVSVASEAFGTVVSNGGFACGLDVRVMTGEAA